MAGIGIVGIDPGLVHTGIVSLALETSGYSKTFSVHTTVVDDGDAAAAADAATDYFPDHIFIEKYEPRSHFGTDARMMELVREIHKHTKHSKIISNTGSKQIITLALLELLHLKKFPATHHQDLQAAARILVYGMLKDPALNRVLFDFVQDHLDGNPWRFM